MIAAATGLRCLVCGKHYALGEVPYVCPDHGNDGVLDVEYDYGRIRRSVNPEDLGGEPSMWRYRALLPVAPTSAVPPLPVGWSPQWRVDGLGSRLGMTDLWIKDDSRLPTGSLKDRASSMAVVKATEAGASMLTTASTGNAAAALAGVCAAVGRRSVIFVPAAAPEAKVAQLLAYGATVLLVEGTYDEAFALCLEAANHFGWYNRSTGFNPFMTEGKKTVAYEMAEQLSWRPPDAVLVPVGDGCIIGAVHKGFADLAALGWTDSMPRLIGVQATGSAFLTEAWSSGDDPLTKAPIVASTVADSIATGLPRDRLKASRAVDATHGAWVVVDDDRILAAVAELAASTGVFAEPAAAASLAGCRAALESGLLGPEERVVLLVTGSGLKDVPAARRAVQAAGRAPLTVGPVIDDVAKALEGAGQ